MRIAHFSDSEPGRVDGVSVSAGLTVGLLRAAGHDVSYHHPGPIRTLPVPARQLRVAAPWLRVDPGPVDVVHVHTPGPIGMAGFRHARRRGIPLVLTWHTDVVAYSDHFFEVPVTAAYVGHRLRLGWTVGETLHLARRQTRRARLVDLGRGMVSYASLVIAPSEKTAAGLTEFGDLPPVRVLPTPVQLPAETPAAVLRDLPLGAPIVLSVGRVTNEKNPGLLLHAFRDLLTRRPGARLVVVGVRQNGDRIRRMVADLGLSEHVRLVPPVPRSTLVAYYKAADVLAFASTTDTQSMVVHEAEACGLPVVVADPQLGHPGGHRITCAATPESFGAALARMLDDPGLYDRTRLAGLAAAAAYTPEVFRTLVEEAYTAAVRAARPLVMDGSH